MGEKKLIASLRRNATYFFSFFSFPEDVTRLTVLAKRRALAMRSCGVALCEVVLKQVVDVIKRG